VTAKGSEPTSPRERLDDLLAADRSYYQSDSSGSETPEEKITGFVPSSPTLLLHTCPNKKTRGRGCAGNRNLKNDLTPCIFG
jgi:hypothetical protein